MQDFTKQSVLDGKQVIVKETHFDNGSVVETITDKNTNKRVKVCVVHVACKSEGQVIKSLYAQEYQEYERMFLN